MLRIPLPEDDGFALALPGECFAKIPFPKTGVKRPALSWGRGGDARPHISVYSVYSVVSKIHWQCCGVAADLSFHLSSSHLSGALA